MAFAPRTPLNSPYITTSAPSPSQNSPTNSAKELKKKDHPAEAQVDLNKRGHDGPIWSWFKGLQTGDSSMSTSLLWFIRLKRTWGRKVDNPGGAFSEQRGEA